MFDFKLLTEGNIRKIIRYTLEQDQTKLLLVCKEWKKVFFPFVWESLTPNANFSYKDKIKLCRKNSHLIKHIDFTTFINIPIYYGLYKNVVDISTCLENYVDRKLHRFNFKITRLKIYDFRDGRDLEDYILENNLDMAHICKDLKYLDVISFFNEKYFIEKIIPILPSTLLSVTLNSLSCDLTKHLYTALPNLKEIKLRGFKWGGDWNSILNNSFINLNFLELSLYRYDDKIIIDSSLMPQLTYLKCWVRQIQFKGKHKLRDILLGFVSSNISFSEEYFPYLRKLTIQSTCSICVQLLQSVFELRTLNALTIDISNGLFFQLDDIFPKKVNNLTSLKLINCKLGYSFFHFLFTCCKQLENLYLLFGKDNKDYYLSEKLQICLPTSSLKLTQLLIKNYYNNLDGVVKQILLNSPNLVSFKTDGICDIDYEILDKSEIIESLVVRVPRLRRCIFH